MINNQMRQFASGDLPHHTKLEMPNLSPTMEKVNIKHIVYKIPSSNMHESFNMDSHLTNLKVIIYLEQLSNCLQGNIAKWLKKEGDQIKPGDILASIETDKASVDFEMQEEGYIAKLLYPEGTKDVKLGQVIAIVVDSADDVSKFKDFSLDAATPAKAAAPTQPAKAEPAQAAPQQTQAAVAQRSAAPVNSSGRVFASPLAKKLAEEKGIDLSLVSGTGPNDRIIKADVEEALQSGVGKQGAKKAAP